MKKGIKGRKLSLDYLEIGLISEPLVPVATLLCHFDPALKIHLKVLHFSLSRGHKCSPASRTQLWCEMQTYVGEPTMGRSWIDQSNIMVGRIFFVLLLSWFLDTQGRQQDMTSWIQYWTYTAVRDAYIITMNPAIQSVHEHTVKASGVQVWECYQVLYSGTSTSKSDHGSPSPMLNRYNVLVENNKWRHLRKSPLLVRYVLVTEEVTRGRKHATVMASRKLVKNQCCSSWSYHFAINNNAMTRYMLSRTCSSRCPSLQSKMAIMTFPLSPFLPLPLFLHCETHL
jgi:hypothetical protein